MCLPKRRHAGRALSAFGMNQGLRASATACAPAGYLSRSDPSVVAAVNLVDLRLDDRARAASSRFTRHAREAQCPASLCERNRAFRQEMAVYWPPGRRENCRTHCRSRKTLHAVVVATLPRKRSLTSRHFRAAWTQLQRIGREPDAVCIRRGREQPGRCGERLFHIWREDDTARASLFRTGRVAGGWTRPLPAFDPADRARGSAWRLAC